MKVNVSAATGLSATKEALITIAKNTERTRAPVPV